MHDKETPSKPCIAGRPLETISEAGGKEPPFDYSGDYRRHDGTPRTRGERGYKVTAGLVLLTGTALFIGLGGLGVIVVVLLVWAAVVALRPRKMLDLRANPVENIAANVRAEMNQRNYERKAKECEGSGGHKWYTDSSDFWLVAEFCSHCNTSKPDSLRINDFGEHILSLPKDERDEEIEDRKGQFRRKWGI